MFNRQFSQLSSRKRYLQIALNSTLEDARNIISQIPISDRILIEAGTPLIKRYGEEGIRKIKQWYEQRVFGNQVFGNQTASNQPLFKFNIPITGLRWLDKLAEAAAKEEEEEEFVFRKSNKLISQKQKANQIVYPYVVADLKMMDRGKTEVEIASRAGADAAVALGYSPIESLNAFIQNCEDFELDAMIDMMNVEYPLSILRQLKKLPRAVILHRGVDEETFNKEKQIPLHEIRRIKGNYDILVAVAGGDTLKEVQRAIFNDADIVVVWKSFFQSATDTSKLAEEFLKEIR